MESVERFIWEYFVRPMYTREGYNPYNTLVYALVLGFAIIYTYRWIIRPLKIRVDERLFYAVTPMVVFGSTVRALVDGGILKPHPLILTPGIFFTAFILIVPAIFADSKLKTYPKITIGWGSLLALYVNYLLIINAKSWRPYELTVFYTIVFLLPILGYYGFKPFEKIYLFPVFAHIFDIGSTIVAIHYYGYREVHWLENILVQKFGAFIYYPWIVFILAVVYYGLRYLVPDEEERKFWYLAVYILGLGPAIRDPAQMILQIMS